MLGPPSELLVCPVCHGALAERSGRVRCRTCALRYTRREGIYLLAPPFMANGTPPTFVTERMRRLVDEAGTVGWAEARSRFRHEVLSGRLRAPHRSRFASLQARLTGTTWEDTLQDLADSTRVGWKFLLAVQPSARVLFLGPSWGAAPVNLARSAAQVVALDGALERLQITQLQAWEAGLDNLTLARVVDPFRLPLADASVDLALVPGLAEWFVAIAGDRRLPRTCGTDLLRELRRVVAPGGQVYVGTDNRLGLSWAFRGRRPRGAAYSVRELRRAAADAGFAECGLFAPVPFRHKFHQVVDLERTDRMNLSADAYRSRGRLARPLVKAWDRLNRKGALERRLYPSLPGLAAVLSTEVAIDSFAERIIDHLASQGHVPPSGRLLSRYYVRPKGAAVLVAGTPGKDGVIVRLPLDQRAEATCVTHHQATALLAADGRIPAALRRLFPKPLATGRFEGQAFFAESSLHGEVGRVYYSLPEARYDQAIVSAAEALSGLRRATEVPTLIDEPEFARLCGSWLGELQGLVQGERREPLAGIERWLRETLLGATLPLGWHHGDYDFANLLYGRGDTVTAILDFEVFEPRGLPLIDLFLLLARRPIRQKAFAFGTLFVSSILQRTLPPLEAELLAHEMRVLDVDDRLYRALALCCWLNHLRLRRDSWLVRSPSWLEDNLLSVLHSVHGVLAR